MECTIIVYLSFNTNHNTRAQQHSTKTFYVNSNERDVSMVPIIAEKHIKRPGWTRESLILSVFLKNSFCSRKKNIKICCNIRLNSLNDFESRSTKLDHTQAFWQNICRKIRNLYLVIQIENKTLFVRLRFGTIIVTVAQDIWYKVELFVLKYFNENFPNKCSCSVLFVTLIEI